jgi:hypothetical protein
MEKDATKLEWGDTVTLYTMALNGPTAPVPNDRRATGWGKTDCSQRNLHKCHFVHHMD